MTWIFIDIMEKSAEKMKSIALINFKVIIEKPPWRARKTAYLSDKKASSSKNLEGIPKKLGT